MASDIRWTKKDIEGIRGALRGFWLENRPYGDYGHADAAEKVRAVVAKHGKEIVLQQIWQRAVTWAGWETRSKESLASIEKDEAAKPRPDERRIDWHQKQHKKDAARAAWAKKLFAKVKEHGIPAEAMIDPTKP